eukprot:2123288-Rhodomonas_salina.3
MLRILPACNTSRCHSFCVLTERKISRDCFMQGPKSVGDSVGAMLPTPDAAAVGSTAARRYPRPA